MSNLFERPRTDAKSTRHIKNLITQRFNLSETVTLAVAELRCHETGCPPIETVVTARYADGKISNWRISKPVNQITSEDLEDLSESK